MKAGVLIIIVMFSNVLEALRPTGALEADTAYKAGEFDKARTLYEDLVVKNPSDMQSLYNAGKAATKAKKFTQAKIAFSHVESSSHSSAELKKQALFNRGDVELLESNYDRALEHYEKVLAIDPAQEGAKKRIELIKKLKEQQKQNTEQKPEQKKDKKKKESSSSKDQDSQSKDQQKDQQKGDEKTPEKSENKGSDNNQRSQQDSQKSDDKSNSEKSSQKDREPQGSQAPQRGSDNSHTNQPQEQQSRQEGTEGDQEKKTQNKEHAQPQQKNTTTEQKEQKSGLVAATPDQHLNEEEKELLSKVEKHDKKVFKTFFAKPGSGKEQRPGQKNW